MILRSTLSLGLLLCAGPAPRPQAWYDPETNYRDLPPTPAEMHASLAAADLAAALELVRETTGALVSEARFAGGEEPAWEVTAYTPEARLLVRTDAAGERVLATEEVARVPGWPMEGEWVELPSGLKYYDVEVGDGREPRNSTVLTRVRYAGYLVDGSRFQGTEEDGEPMVSPLSGAIPGWREGLLSMKSGGKRKLLVPPELGYGDAGYGCLVPPGATLIFDVHLLRWK